MLLVGYFLLVDAAGFFAVRRCLLAADAIFFDALHRLMLRFACATCALPVFVTVVLAVVVLPLVETVVVALVLPDLVVTVFVDGVDFGGSDARAWR